MRVAGVPGADSLHPGTASPHRTDFRPPPLPILTRMPRGRIGYWGLAAGFWILFGVACAVQVWVSMLAHNHSLTRLILYEIAVWSAWIVVGRGVARLVRRYPIVPFSASHFLLHLLTAAGTAVLHTAWWVGLELLMIPFDVMNPKAFGPRFVKLLFYQSPLEMMLYAMVALTVVAYDAWVRAREREVRSAQLETLLAEARLSALELQLRPHFLFNTLNAVSALVHTGARDQALGMIGGLSDLLRYALDRAGAASATVADEAVMARRYLEIQQLRVPDRLSFTIEVAPEAQRGAVPVLLLQPLVENAVRHGIEPSQAAGRVTVRIVRDGDRLRIRIWNSGRLVARRAEGIGLANTAARLEQLYPGRHELALREEDSGVVATIVLPWSEIG